YSDEFSDLDGRHFGPKIESAPLHPALLALVTPWREPDHYSRLMRQLPNLSLTGILLRDSGWGRVTSKDGTSRVDYRLSRQDLAHMRKGIEVGVRILEAAGAKEIFTSQSAYVAYRPGQRGGVDAYMNEVDRNGYKPGQMGYVSFHQMGSCRMGNDPATSVIGPDHRAHAVKGLFVAIPSIVDGLHAGLDEILWVLNAYILVYAVLLITAGRLGDKYGAKRLFLIGLAVFTFASIGCSLAQSPSQLILARIVQGIGGAILTPQTL